MTILSLMLTTECCLVAGLGLGLGLDSSVRLVSGYAHVFILISVVIVSHSPSTWTNHQARTLMPEMSSLALTLYCCFTPGNGVRARQTSRTSLNCNQYTTNTYFQITDLFINWIHSNLELHNLSSSTFSSIGTGDLGVGRPSKESVNGLVSQW